MRGLVMLSLVSVPHAAGAAGMPDWWRQADDPLMSPRSDEDRLESELKGGRCCPWPHSQCQQPFSQHKGRGELHVH